MKMKTKRNYYSFSPSSFARFPLRGAERGERVGWVGTVPDEDEDENPRCDIQC